MEWFGRAITWYGMLPPLAKTLISLTVGVIIAILIFRLALAVLKTVIRAVIAGILAFLLTTVPGNMLLAHAYDDLTGGAADSSVGL